jgi:hypothetical protein
MEQIVIPVVLSVVGISTTLCGVGTYYSAKKALRIYQAQREIYLNATKEALAKSELYSKRARDAEQEKGLYNEQRRAIIRDRVELRQKMQLQIYEEMQNRAPRLYKGKSVDRILQFLRKYSKTYYINNNLVNGSTRNSVHDQGSSRPETSRSESPDDSKQD